MCILFCTPKRHPQRYVGPSGHSRFKLILRISASGSQDAFSPFRFNTTKRLPGPLCRALGLGSRSVRAAPGSSLQKKARSREEADLRGTARVVGAYMGGTPTPEPTPAKFESWRWNIVALKERHRWSTSLPSGSIPCLAEGEGIASVRVENLFWRALRPRPYRAGEAAGGSFYMIYMLLTS